MLCPTGTFYVVASLGDGADRFDATGTSGFHTGFFVDGEDGDDDLLGSPGLDFLLGGRGRDTVAGGAGGDSLAGDGGGYVYVEELRPASVRLRSKEDDRIDGGPGIDKVTYSARREPVLVDLGDLSAPAGSSGETDVLSTIEQVTGGRADDVLSGDQGPNFLSGGPGDDRLFGRGSDDGIEGGTGSDFLSGGAGADRLYPLADPQLGGRTSLTDGDNWLACGDGGPDKAHRIQPVDVVELDCERPYLQCNCELRLRPLTALTSAPIAVTLPRGGRVMVRVAKGPASGRLLGRRSVSAASDGNPRRLRVRLSRAGQTLVARKKVIRARVTISRPRGDTIVFQTVLRAPRL